MRYENNHLLRDYLNRGAAGAHREHLKHPAFDLDPAAFAETLAQVGQQHPHLSANEAAARAAFRLLTSGAPPEVAAPQPSQWYAARAYAVSHAPQAWRAAKLAWAIALLLLAVATLLLLSAQNARSEPLPQNVPAVRNAYANVNVVSANQLAHALLIQPPKLLPQIAGGSVAARLQFLNSGNLWTNTSSANPLPITCISGCSGGSSGGSAVLSGQQSVTASAAALATNTTKTVCIKAEASNMINVYVGPSGVSAATGMELAPGNAYCAPANNTNLFYVIAPTIGAAVSWIASN